MSLAQLVPFRPARPAASTRHLLDLAAVAGDHLRRGDGALVAALAADAAPLALRAPAEAEGLIEQLRLALAALAWPIQVLVELGPLDVEASVVAHTRATAGETDGRLRRLAADHRAFLRSLARDHRLLERRVALVLAVPAAPDPAAPALLPRWLRPATDGSSLSPDEAARELAVRCAELDQRLRPCGVALRRLAGPELAGLLHHLVQPGPARRQPLAMAALAGPTDRRLIDDLAPGAAEEAPDWLRVDDAWCATLAVVGYRREVGADWLAALWRCGLPLRVALHLAPLAAGTALARLERRRTRLEASAAVDAHQGRTAKASAAVALEDVAALEEAVERGAEQLLTVSIYLTVAADAPAALAEHVRQVESLLGGLGLRSVRLTFAQPAGYRATLPLGRDEPQRGQARTCAAVAAAFPFAAASARGDGVLLGVDLAGGGLVELPTAGEVPNRNLAVLGPSGGGKSYAVKAALLRALLLGTTVWIVDREGEYAALAAAAGGRTVRLAPSARGAGLNPLALPAAADTAGATRDALVAERVATVTALVGLLAGGRDGLTPAEEAAVEAALGALYGDDPSPADASAGAVEPTLVDLQRWLARGDEPGRGLAARLARYAGGALAGLVDGTGAPADARLLRWDLRDLPEELTAAALLLLADAVWTAARRRPDPRLLVIDEAWRLIAHPAGGRFLADLARRARKHALGLWVISQDVRDLLDDPHGRAIAANAAAALLPPQNERTIDAVAAAFGLGAGERAQLLRAQTGEALLVAGRQRRAVRVLAPPELAPLITTDPRVAGAPGAPDPAA
ncbi:MAG: DUF87 domain-containing protein [Chloroflexi bacterium]|nr:DUF87 domain-containing protein [Chloroflexota bacterium]